MSYLKKKNKEYFKKMIRNLNALELLALMEAITDYGMEMAKISGKLPVNPGKTNTDQPDVQ
jgi:hypothetical protein